MSNRNHRILFLPALLAVLVLALFFVQPVSADDGATPEPTAVVETEIPAVETPVEVTETPTAVETPLPAETAVIPDVPAASETPAVESTLEPSVDPTVEPAAPEPVLEDVVQELTASGIELVDAASGGQITRDAGAVLDGDPYYTVGTITYRFLNLDGDCGTDIHCSLSANPIQAALDSMTVNGTPSDRKLYIEADDYSGDVVVDGTIAAVRPLTGFVVKKGTPEEVATLSGSITIHDMPAGFSISDFTVTNSTDNGTAIFIHDNAGTVSLTNVDAKAAGVDGSGIRILDSGNVVMKQVDASENGYAGALIETSGTVSITNSSFNSNQTNYLDGNAAYDFGYPMLDGLFIYGASSITLTGVSADDNGGSGAFIAASGSLGVPGIVTIKNSSFNSNNSLYTDAVYAAHGLTIWAKTVTMDWVSVADNGDGDTNAGGIYVEARASFTGTNLLADSNQDTGIDVNTCYSDSGCDNTLAGTVVLKNTSASHNGEIGVNIYAKGAVTLYGVKANENNEWGMILNNERGPLPALINATLLETSNNFLGGSWISTKGAVTITNLTASDNSGDGGVKIESSGTAPITITLNTGYAHRYNETSRNGGYGLEISAGGPITIISLNSDDNDYSGICIYNGGSNTAVTTIKVMDATAGAASYTRNEWNGLEIHTNGPVVVANVNASENDETGAYLQSYYSTVSVTNGLFNNNCLHVDGVCDYSNSGAVGLSVDSWGQITLLNVSASGNDSYGAQLVNNGDGATAGVTIKAAAGKANVFSGNSLTGLIISSHGAVLLTNITASDNGWDTLTANGLEITTGLITDTLKVTGNVTLIAGTGMGNLFLGNSNHGLTITTNGAVTLTNLTAIGNEGNGVNINNSSGLLPVILKQAGSWTYGADATRVIGNLLSGNSGNGVDIVSNGAVTIAFFQVKGNVGSGIVVDADEGLGAVTLNGLAANYRANVSGNYMNGITLTARGNLLLNYIDSGNGNYGAVLDNSSGPGSVTINYGYFDGGFYGLSVNTISAVTWKNGSASGNCNYGAEITNAAADSAKPVTISNVSADDNGETGLKINSKGAVLLTNVAADGNSSNGESIGFGEQFVDNLSTAQTWSFYRGVGETVTIEIDTDAFTADFRVFDQYGSELGSGETYLRLDAATGEAGYYTIVLNSADGRRGRYVIDLYNIDNKAAAPTGHSEAYGIYVDNSSGTSAAVSLINTNRLSSSNNSAENIYITTSGAVTVTNTSANDGGSYGFNIIATTASAAPAVTLTNLSASRNTLDGIYSTSMGAVTARNITADGNLGGGLNITNNNSDTYYLPVSLTSVSASVNGAGGIQVASNGAVTLAAITASGNTANGIDILTKGAVTATTLTVWLNGNRGVSISTDGAVTINRPASGYNTIEYNTYDGLYITALGKVALNRVNASNNGYDSGGLETGIATGINITVTDATGRSPILLTDVFADHNSNDGVYIATNGALTINLLDSDGNNFYGLRIVQGDGVVGTVHYLYPVVLRRISTDHNGWDGISLDGAGSVTLSKFTANYNANNGVSLNNKSTGSPKASITILNPAGGLATNQAIGNGWIGLLVESNGIINVTGVTADMNGQDGVIIRNNSSSSMAPVTLTAITARSNGADGSTLTSGNGIYVTSLGLVTINNSVSTGNDWDGIQVFTQANAFINYTTSMGNGGAGIYADLAGTYDLTLKGCFWFGNHLGNLDFIGDDLFIL